MTVTAPASGKKQQTVWVDNGSIVIEMLVVHDRDAAQYVALAKDGARAVEEAVKLGVRILRLTETSGDVEMVKRQFDGMVSDITGNVDRMLAEARDAVGKRLTEFSTEELQRWLNAHRERVTEELVRLFGPESAVSVQRQIDSMLKEKGEEYVQGLLQVLERTDDPENPFYKLREELKGKAEEAVKEIRELRDKVLEIVGQAKGAAAEREKGTAKGRTYQEFVHEQIEKTAAIFGDTALNVADETGEKGRSKAGDICVELNPRDTSFAKVRMVFEAKNKRYNSAKDILDELAEAMENRMALAAAAVFSSVENVPRGLRSWRDYPGHKYICVCSEDRSDEFALEFTYRCARFDALQSIEPEEARLDLQAIRDRLKQMKGRLDALRQMKTNLNAAGQSIEKVQGLIDEHRRDLSDDLDAIDRLLSVQREGEAA